MAEPRFSERTTFTRQLHIRLDDLVFKRFQRLQRRTGMAPGTLARVALTVWSERPTLEEPVVGMDVIEWLENTPEARALVLRLRAESIDSRRNVREILTDGPSVERLLGAPLEE